MSFSLWLSSSHWEIRMYNSFLATHELSQLSKKILQGTSASSNLPLLALELSASPWPSQVDSDSASEVHLFTGFTLICSPDSNSTSAAGLPVHSTPVSHLLSTVSLGAPGPFLACPRQPSRFIICIPLNIPPRYPVYAPIMASPTIPNIPRGCVPPMPVNTFPLPAVSLELWGLPSQPSKLC